MPSAFSVHSESRLRAAHLEELEDDARRRAAVGSDAYAWEQEFGREHDASALVVESNVFRYRSYPLVWVRTEPAGRPVEVLRLVLAGVLAGSRVRISLDPVMSAELKAIDGRNPSTSAALRVLARYVDRAECSEDFVARVARGEVGGRLRVVGTNPRLLRELAQESTERPPTVYDGPVLATGRRELLVMLREQALSQTMHRFGHLPPSVR